MSETNVQADPAPELGDLLAGSPYRVIAKIGAGGMGTVLEAEHRALGKRVVVKVLLPQFAREPKVIDRLKREARVLAKVASPYIVEVSDLGQTSAGLTYVVMERLHGRTLGQELKARGALPVVEAIRWTRQILAGLGDAHKAGVVHRDIKPENVFLCDATAHEPRRIKLLDFGIAKVLDGAGDRFDSLGHQPTAEGMLLGSPRWLAPEQARGLGVDARTDIYSVGLLLYTLIAGRGPFAHVKDPIEAMGATLMERPQPPSTYARQPIPPVLDDAVLMTLAKDPAQRFQTAEAFARALEVISCQLEGTTQPLPAMPEAGRIALRPALPAPATDPESDTITLQQKVRLVPRPVPRLVRSLPSRESFDPTIVRRPPPSASEASLWKRLTPEDGHRRAVMFILVTAATSTIFTAIIALMLRMLWKR